MTDQNKQADQGSKANDQRDDRAKRSDREIASKGGQISGGKAGNDPERAAEAGREGVKESRKDRH